MNTLYKFSQSPFYWLAMILASIVGEAVALYYQYVLEDYPCVICIHIRIWVAAFTLLGIAGLFLRKSKSGLLIANLLALVFSIGLLERSYVLYGTEEGWVQGMCAFALNFPEWFALDKWFPLMFEVQGACGFTPELLFGITMAQGLLVTGAFACTLSLAVLIPHVKVLASSTSA